MRLDGPIATWRRVPMPRSGPDEVDAAAGEIVVVSARFDVLLVTPSSEASAVVRRYADVLVRATKEAGLDPVAPEELAGVLCAEIEMNRLRGTKANADGGE